jgi:aminoglycoside phosphotransferase (APT) family kinase protein
VTAREASELIARAFPDLAGRAVEPFGQGWDNTAFLVGGVWVFRFPRRAIAAPLLELEARVLPRIAGRLPLAVPRPTRLAKGGALFPWPFAGYPYLAGKPASALDLDDAVRARAARPMGEMLRALHSITVEEGAALGAAPDAIGRLDPVTRVPLVRARLDRIARLGLVTVSARLEGILDRATPPAPPTCLAHGDLYSRHVLFDERLEPSAVIDWGDLHLGDPAVDLAFAFLFLPRSSHSAFEASYGSIAEDTWARAKLKALITATALVLYGIDAGDADLVREGRWTLDRLA